MLCCVLEDKQPQTWEVLRVQHATVEPLGTQSPYRSTKERLDEHDRELDLLRGENKTLKKEVGEAKQEAATANTRVGKAGQEAAKAQETIGNHKSGFARLIKLMKDKTPADDEETLEELDDIQREFNRDTEQATPAEKAPKEERVAAAPTPEGGTSSSSSCDNPVISRTLGQTLWQPAHAPLLSAPSSIGESPPTPASSSMSGGR